MKNLINNNRPQSPCKGCENRYVGCHSNCDDYLEFRGKTDEMAKRIYEKNRDRDLYMGYRKECSMKIQEKRRKK